MLTPDVTTGYLAARYSRREELCEYRTELEKRDHVVRARWLEGEHQVHGLSKQDHDNGQIPTELASKFANDDVEDILSSRWMINFTEKPRKHKTRGGRHAELGIFLGLKFTAGQWDPQRKLYLIGPLEHVFHCLAEIDGVFDDFDAFLEAHDAGDAPL